MKFKLKSFGRATLAVRGFSAGGRTFASLVVKAAGSFLPDSGEVMLDPTGPALVPEDRTLRGSPLASLEHASDLALVVPHAEVLVSGCAHAPRGTVVQSLKLRLVVTRNGMPVLGKELVAVAPKPFEILPIVYERAQGGMSSRVNPVGVGLPPDTTVPNIRYAKPDAPAAAEWPAGFGPIPSSWPVRKSRRGALSAQAASHAPFVELPADFDESYFQSAPADQWVGELHPGDVISCSGVRPTSAPLFVVIPAARAVALVQRSAEERQRLDLRLDTLRIDAETSRVELLFRGVVPLEREALETAAYGAAIEVGVETFTFPDLGRVEAPANVVAPPPGQHTFRGTQVIELDAPAAKPVQATLELELPADAAPRHASTMVLEVEPAPRSLPFARRGAKDVRSEPHAPPPGSPWAKDATGDAPAPRAADLHGTLVLEPPRDAAAEPLPPPPAPPPPAAPEPPAKRESEPPPAKRSVWRDDPPPAAPEPPKPPPPKPAPKADLSKHLYKKSKR